MEWIIWVRNKKMMEVIRLKECIIIVILAVDTRGKKKMRVWEVPPMQYRTADRFEECNPCLVIETIHIYDFVFALCADHISFIADNIQKKCNKRHVSLRNKTLVKKVLSYSGLLCPE